MEIQPDSRSRAVFNINIGSAVTSPAGENNTIRIGDNLPRGGLTSAACFIGGISGVTLPSGAPVVVDTDGQLGVAATSSARFKDEIKPMDKASEAILALKPVTFRYNKEIDRKGVPQFGLVAEEVEKVNPDLVTRDRDGKLYTVRYDAVNAMLLNEFLKEHRTVQDLKSTVSKAGGDCRATAKGNQSPYCRPKRAGRANPEGERPA